MIQKKQIGFGSMAVALAALTVLTGCNSDSAPSATARPAATTATTATATTPVRKEITYVSSARAPLAATVDALSKGNIAAAQTAFENYDIVWNGVEVYINYRSLPTYQDLELNWQAKITAALAAPQPKAADILPMVQSMLAKYDEAITLVQTGPAISPLFDDVAAIRTTRSPVRKVPAALQANDLTKAKGYYDSFANAWPSVKTLLGTRATNVPQEVDDAMAKVKTTWTQSNPRTQDLIAQVAVVTERFNYGLSLVNAAARGSDVKKTTYTSDDLGITANLGKIEAELKNSLSLWQSGKYSESLASAQKVNGAMFDGVSAPLKAKGADAALKTAISDYVTVAGAAGDSEKVAALNKKAVEATWVAEQWIAGQFWLDAKFQTDLAAAIKR